MAEPADVPIVILCGGRGIHADDSGQRLSKALVRVLGEPMVLHVMRRYAGAGFRRFLLSCGRQAAELERAIAGCDGARAVNDHAYELSIAGATCRVSLVDGGADSTTGERLRRVQPLLAGAPVFGVTYSDTLAAVDPAAIFRAHAAHGKIATLLGARVPTRFRILGLRRGETIVRGFAARPVIMNDLINGGFYFFGAAIWGETYLGAGPDIVLEEQVLEALAARSELVAFPYDGPWQYLDGERDLGMLERLIRSLS